MAGIKFVQDMTEQQGRLLQLALTKQILASKEEYQEFSREGSRNLAAAAREHAEWLESLNAMLQHRISKNRGD